MGYMALSDFRSSVQSALGNRSLANASLDQYINFGYLDIAGAITFQVLNSEYSLTTLAANFSVDAPSNIFSVLHIRNVSNRKLLTWMPLPDLFRKIPLTPPGEVVGWNHYGSKIYLFPTADAVYTLNAFVRRSPDRLTDAADVSVLPDEFDTPILMMANYYGFLLNAEEERASYWLGLAINNLQAKLVESDVDPHALEAIEGFKQRLVLLQNSQGAA